MPPSSACAAWCRGSAGSAASSRSTSAASAQPVLVASTDGVGTKMVVARDTGRYETVGIDLVAMCVDDLVCVGAEPLFMLDYIATGKVDPDQVATVVAGVHEGCRQAGLRVDRRGDGRARRRHAARRARSGRLRRRRGGAGDPARSRARARRRRHRRAAVARAAFERLHPGPARPARAGRARAGRSRPGRGRTTAWPTSCCARR